MYREKLRLWCSIAHNLCCARKETLALLHQSVQLLCYLVQSMCTPDVPPVVTLLWQPAGLIRGLSSLDDDRGFKDKFLDGGMEQPVQSQEAQVQLGELHTLS